MTVKRKKTRIVLYDNKTKKGVDTVDQILRNHSCKRLTRKLQTVHWYNMLNMATLNEFTIFKALQPKYMRGVTHARRLFIKELTKQLVMPLMKKRHARSSLQKPIKESMMRCSLTFHNADVVQPQQTPASKWKICDICQFTKHRKVRCYRSQSHEEVCSEHSVSLVTCLKCGGNAQ